MARFIKLINRVSHLQLPNLENKDYKIKMGKLTAVHRRSCYSILATPFGQLVCFARRGLATQRNSLRKFNLQLLQASPFEQGFTRTCNIIFIYQN